MLLKTRFYLPPLRKNCVIRNHLTAKLNAVKGGEIALISAPAGFGKTTLVSQWLHLHPQTFCWLSLGQEHNSPALFWQYAATALQQIQPDLAQLQISEEVPIEQFVIALINALDDLSVMNHSDSVITLVLDDFHAIENPKLLYLINSFLDHLPPSVRLVMTCREEPPIGIAKRRASNQLKTISQKTLSFSEDETVDFFQNTLSINLPVHTLHRLYQTTEGWVTGLQLAAISIEQHRDNDPIDSKSIDKWSAPDNIDRHITDYLFEEVFTCLSSEQKTMLLAAAQVKKFSAGLLNAILDVSTSLSDISQLEKANLFLIPLDNHRTWYRFHDLFRQFLLQQSHTLSEAHRHGYINKASAWLFESGYIEEAIELAMENQQWPIAIKLLRQLQKEDWPDNSKTDEWLSRIPDITLNKYPELQRLKNNTMTNEVGALLPQETPRSEVTPGAEPLTKREQQVLMLIAEGLSNQEITEKLFISLNTLKVHIRNLYGKMGVETRHQAIAKAQDLLNP